MIEKQITGLDELYRSLQDLPVKIERNVMRGALRAGIGRYRDLARARVPEDSGDLKSSIRIRFARRSERFGWVRGYLVAGNKKAFYAHMIEFGTASHYEGIGTTVGGPYRIVARLAGSLFLGGIFRSQVTHPGIKPQPFMRPALDQGTDEAIRAAADYVRERLPKEIAKAGP